MSNIVYSKLSVADHPVRYRESLDKCVLLNGVELSEFIYSHSGEQCAHGLMTALVPENLEMDFNGVEKRIIKERIFPQIGSSARCPILTCPDDLSITCVTIYAEVFVHSTHVEWRRFGFDGGCAFPVIPEEVGDDVRWFSSPQACCFELSGYQDFLGSLGLI